MLANSHCCPPVACDNFELFRLIIHDIRLCYSFVCAMWVCNRGVKCVSLPERSVLREKCGRVRSPWKSRLDWLIFQNSGFLTIYSCAECLFFWNITEILIFALHYCFCPHAFGSKKEYFWFCFIVEWNLKNWIWIVDFIFKIVRLSSWTNSLMNRSYENEVKMRLVFLFWLCWGWTMSYFKI